MLRCGIVVLLLFSTCVALFASALNVTQNEQSTFVEGIKILPRSVQLSNKSFCFFTIPVQGDSQRGDVSTLCSFDGGASVKPAKLSHSICTSGVVVDQSLYCPNEELPHDEEGEMEFSSVAHAVQSGELSTEDSEKRFVFKSGKQTGEVKQILFDGNSVRLDDDDAHILVSTIINDAEERRVAVFKSEDGFTFRAIAVIPDVEMAEAHYLFSEGNRRLSVVSAYENSIYTTTSSGYAGNFWSAPKAVNVTTPPASAAFSSGVLIQYACSNETSKLAKWYLLEDVAKHPLSPKSFSVPALKDAGGTPLLFFSVASADNTNELVIVHDDPGSNPAAGIRLSVYKVDDSTEAKEKADRIAKEMEELLRREAARFKAKMERLEREKAQRREQRRKELERKRKFLADDAPNVNAAKSYMDMDGEMIIIRRVHKDSIALEKEVFFSDL